MFRSLLICALLVTIYGASIKDDFQLDGRIVGGHAISINHAPYQASYELNGRQKCGASIINHHYALSAAHCSIRDDVRVVAIRVGSDQRASGGSVHPASQIINHARYSTFPSPNFDISLIRVNVPFAYSANVQPVALARSVPTAGTPVVTSGWGAIHEDGPASSQLLQVQVDIIGDAACRRAYPLRITNQMFCAGVDAGGKDTCQGDSGGPLVAGRELVGVVSWGAGCARPRRPGVYANVPSLRSWILENSE